MSTVLRREVKLSVVSYLTNTIVDQILQELYATHKTLVNMAPGGGKVSLIMGGLKICVRVRLARFPI